MKANKLKIFSSTSYLEIERIANKYADDNNYVIANAHLTTENHVVYLVVTYKEMEEN